MFIVTKIQTNSKQYSYVNIRLQFYLQLLEAKYDYKASNDELEKLLFIKMGEIIPNLKKTIQQDNMWSLEFTNLILHSKELRKEEKERNKGRKKYIYQMRR